MKSVSHSLEYSLTIYRFALRGCMKINPVKLDKKMTMTYCSMTKFWPNDQNKLCKVSCIKMPNFYRTICDVNIFLFNKYPILFDKYPILPGFIGVTPIAQSVRRLGLKVTGHETALHVGSNPGPSTKPFS